MAAPSHLEGAAQMSAGSETYFAAGAPGVLRVRTIVDVMSGLPSDSMVIVPSIRSAPVCLFTISMEFFEPMESNESDFDVIVPSAARAPARGGECPKWMLRESR